MKRKILSILLCGMLLGLAACGNGGDSSNTEAEPDTAQEETQVEAEDVANAEGEKIVLEFINGSAEEPYVAWLDEMIASFEEENPNITIDVQRVSVDSFNQTVMTRFAAGDVPDLFTFSENDVADMVPSGYVHDLSDSANLANYTEGMLDTLSLDGKVYALPMANDFMCVTYNKKAFADAGITEVPQTWSDFIAACEKLKEQEILPIASGFSEQWVINGTSQTAYCASVLANGGPDLASLVDRSAKFEDTAQWKDCLTKLQELYPYMNADPFGADQNACYSMLANGEAAMILNGTWTVTNASTMNPDGEFGIFAFPASETAEDNKMPMCPASSAFAVSEESEHREEAVQFVEYITSPESATLYAEKGAGIPIIKGVDTSALTGGLKDAADIMNSGEVEMISSKSFPSANEDAFINNISAFFLDECQDVEGTLKNLDADFDGLSN